MQRLNYGLTVVALFVTSALALAQQDQPVLREIPAVATRQLANSLAAAAPVKSQMWRDTPSLNPDGTVNAYVEISRGDRRKFEFDMASNALALDRMIPEEIGGYTVNYGFVPQTISYDGDPFDVLVLGPALPNARIYRGVIVGLLYMDDEKGLDSKVVVSTADQQGRARYDLSMPVRDEIAGFFRRYKLNQRGKFSRVSGWGSAATGREHVVVTHAFFERCRTRPGESCRIPTSPTLR